jgi:pimeloyl-ACP methyl ester carboxylesterase
MTGRAAQRVRSDGLELAVETFGEGSPIVFAHGLSGSRHGVRAQLAPLADRYRIVVYDQRGHNDSTPITDAALYDADRMAEDMTAVLDALGIERAIVGGESMGAATTLLFALAHPERVERLLITAPAFGDRPNPERQRLTDMARAIAGVGMDEFLKRAAVRQSDDLGWPPRAIEHVRASFASHDQESLVAALEAVANWVPIPDLAILGSLTCPVSMIAWEQDALHPIELARRVALALPNTRMETIAPLPAIFLTPEVVGQVYRRSLESP